MFSIPNSRRLLLGAMAVGALVISFPLSAQGQPEAEQQAEAAAVSSDEQEIVAPFGLAVLGGEAEATTVHPIGEVLAPDQTVCLARLQFLVVSANGEEIDYAGPGCLEPRDGLEVPDSVYAGSHIWRPLAEDSPRWAAGEAGSMVVIAASGPSATTFPAGRRLTGDEQIVLRAGDRLTLLGTAGSRVLTGPGTFSASTAAGPAHAAAAARSSTRLRTGAVRGGGAVPVVERLIATRGTPGALRKFPRGTLIGSVQKICLAPGDRLTVARRSGARTTYAGPGCGRSVEGPGEDNTAAVTPG